MPEATSQARSNQPPSPNLFGSIRHLWGLLIYVLYTRLSLVTTELEEERERLESLIIWGIVTMVTSLMTIFSLTLFVIVLIWESPYRVVIIGGIAVLFAVISGILLISLRVKIMNRPRFLGQTLDELKRDVESIRAVGKTVAGNPPA